MATLEEILQAAANADKAGDAEAARSLVQYAKTLMPKQEENYLAPPSVEDVESRSYPVNPQVDRFGDTIADAVEGPLAATKQYYAQSQDRSRSRLERAGDYAMTGLSALGTGYAFGAGLAAEVGAGVLGDGSPSNERRLARDLMLGGQVAVPELAGVSSVARVPAVTAARVSLPEKAVTPGQQAARSADDLGITPSLGAGGKVRAMTAAGLEKVPVVGDVIAKDAARFVGEIERVFDSLSGKVGAATVPSEAGSVLQGGLRRFVEKFQERSTALYANVAEKIPDDTLIQAPETVRAIRDAIAPFADKPAISRELGLGKWAAIADDLESGLSWRAASDLRSSIGQSIGKINGALADMDQGKLKLAYGKLTNDLENAAKAAGDEAYTAWQNANRYYKNGAERIEKSLDATINANHPERAFEAFVAMSKSDKASADVKRMRDIKASLKPGEWRDISASIVDRLGKPTPGQQAADGGGFSAQRFLTQWNGMSDEAKRLLLPGDVREELQKLADVAAKARDANAERDFLNTGTVAGLLGLGAAFSNAPVATTLAVGGVWGSAKGMTSPIFLRALNRAARGDSAQIKAMANGSGPFAEDAKTILRLMAAESAATGAANNQNSPLRAVQ